MYQNFVYNNDEVYLEQDWFYLGADSDAGVAVLRQLPPSAALKDVKDGAYRIERRAAWRIRLLDSTAGGAGLSLAQQQMERLLFRAKLQLKQSKKMRAGQTKTYAPDLRGGGGFSRQLRTKIAASTAASDQRQSERQDRRLDRLAAHLTSKADAMNRRRSTVAAVERGRDFAYPSDFRLRDATDSTSGATGQAASTLASLAPTTGDGNSPAKLHGPTVSSDRSVHVCALCQSSTIAYNLCSQTQSVLDALTTESARASITSGRLESDCTMGDSATITDSTTDLSHSSESSAGSASPPHALSSSRRKSRGREVPVMTPPPPTTPAALLSHPHHQRLDEHARILALFSRQDAHMLDIIRFQERTAHEALIALEHARMGLSPVASHFRDRFKHVGLLAHAHRASVVEQDGIGGHFHKLHTELLSSAAATTTALEHVEELAEALGTPGLALDKHTGSLEYPYEGFDDAIDDVPDLVERLHVFPTADELELIAPIDTKAMLALYAQSRAAVAEMLDGFVELCESHVVPSLRRAKAANHRTALVEGLEFLARAAEFVSARRLQVRVAGLLHTLAGSAVGAMGAVESSVDGLLTEVDATLAFVRFYRAKGASKRKTKDERP